VLNTSFATLGSPEISGVGPAVPDGELFPTPCSMNRVWPQLGGTYAAASPDAV
jgi:hypothetical protein